MRQLNTYRPGYLATRGADAATPGSGSAAAGFVPVWVEDAHRVVRNLVAIGYALALPAAHDARDAVVAAEHTGQYQPAGAAAVARLGDQVATALATTLDAASRPTGALAPTLVEEATRPLHDQQGDFDHERVFVLDEDDGSVRLIRHRMSLGDFVDELPVVTAFLHRAAAAGAIVEFADGPPEPPDPFGLHLA